MVNSVTISINNNTNIKGWAYGWYIYIYTYLTCHKQIFVLALQIIEGESSQSSRSLEEDGNYFVNKNTLFSISNMDDSVNTSAENRCGLPESYKHVIMITMHSQVILEDRTKMSLWRDFLYYFLSVVVVTVYW